MYITIMTSVTIQEAPQFLSFYLIPLLFFGYLYIPSLRSSLYIHGFIIAIIGCLDAYYQSLPNVFLSLFVYAIHIAIVIPMILYPEWNISYLAIFLLWCAILIIHYLPWWPYAIKKDTMIDIYLLLFCIFTLMIHLFLHPSLRNNSSS